MSPTAGQSPRLTLRNRPAPRPPALWLAALGGPLLIVGILVPPLQPITAAGALLLLPLLWALRPGPVTVIDCRAGCIEERGTLGRLHHATRFDHIEGVACDRVTLPARAPGGTGLTIHRTILLTGKAPVPVRGFGAPGPARELKQRIEQWLAARPNPADRPETTP
ncbi:MAG: hypothetical protein JXQ91_20235 [Vannielia sp.]|uniref:hypothetical protein n=1 Tax=Vannielia sp. TaxID=2813045 RepID=UPI003B8B9CF8